MFPVMDPMYRVSGCFCLYVFMRVFNSLIFLSLCYCRNRTINLAALDIRKHLNDLPSRVICSI